VLENLEFEDIESLGFQLITTLINQLDGELELQRNNGTEFTTRFTVEEKSKNQLLGAYAVELKNQLY
jgi:two-component sensor histidine kinase